MSTTATADSKIPGYSATEIAELPVIIEAYEAARLLRMSKRSLVRYAGEGEIPCLRIGNKFRFVRDTLLELSGISYEEVLKAAADVEMKRAEILGAEEERRRREEERTGELLGMLRDMAERLV